jgi:hypothetical protein
MSSTSYVFKGLQSNSVSPIAQESGEQKIEQPSQSLILVDSKFQDHRDGSLAETEDKKYVMTLGKQDTEHDQSACE